MREKLQAWNRQWQQAERESEGEAPQDEDSMPKEFPIPDEVGKRIVTALDGKLDCVNEGLRAETACRDEFESLEDWCRGCRPGTLDECAPVPQARCLAAERAMVVCFHLGKETSNACWRNFQNEHEEEGDALKAHEQTRLARFLNDVENDRELDPDFNELMFLMQLQEALGKNYTVEKYYDFLYTLENIGYSMEDFRRFSKNMRMIMWRKIGENFFWNPLVFG